MKRLEYPLNHEWHVLINQYNDALRATGKEWEHWLYTAKAAADEIPRMMLLFKAEREDKLPKTHQQCSMSEPEPIVNNELTCCKGVKTKECPILQAMELIERARPEDIYLAKAWTCGTHIISTGGDPLGEGFMLRTDDRMYWNNVYESLAQSDEDLQD